MDQKPEDSSLETLEEPSTSAPAAAPQPSTSSSSSSTEGESLEGHAPAAGQVTTAEPVAQKRRTPIFKRILARLNIYFLLFILIVVLAAGTVVVGIEKNKKAETPTSISTQQLTADQLSKLKGSDATVGDAKQTLTIQSNAIFNDAVLVKGSLDVAGPIKVGGALNLPGITVSGTSTFDQIVGNKLTISGDANIQGQTTIQKGLTVTGGATFGGPISAPQLTIQSLQLNNDLQINKHIDAGGPTPSKSDGSGLGSGGTSSVSGTDTAGTVAINFGGGASSSACYITVNFTSRFPDTPHVVISPSSAAAAQLNYYVNRSSSNFQVCSAGGSAGGNATFDYTVID